MTEIIITEKEEIVRASSQRIRPEPAVTLSDSAIYFNCEFADIFPGDRVKISRSGPYIIFRPAVGTSDSYAITRRKDVKRGALIGTPALMQLLNPSGQKATYDVLPVKGGGWCIKIF